MSSTRLKIFISSVQKEFGQIRSDLKAFLLGDAFLRRFISEVFLFEELPAKDRHADEVYLEQVKRCNIYIGIFGYEYGSEDEKGVSPTEHEFNQATENHKTRLIYVWCSNEKRRAPAMKKLIAKASGHVIRRRIEDASGLTSEVYASIVDYLDSIKALRVPPFDTSACEDATIKDLARKRIAWFLDTAKRERGFPLNAATTTQALLTHLNLFEHGKPANAAVLLFGTNPQRFYRTAETKCVHCHGAEYRRPFASQQIYSGDLFEQADQARDFVLAKINRSVGTRATSITAAATYELPPDAVGEAIVNAITHRDYNSNASVEVRLFSDRLEVWNPGSLPGNLTLENLLGDHPSIPNNPLIAESLYLTRYIEKAGSGTQMMIDLCHEAGLPQPDFELRQGSFVVTLWRDWLTDEVLAGLNLNARQLKILSHLKKYRKITNSEIQEIGGASRITATRDLYYLVDIGIAIKVGKTGKGTYYILSSKRIINASNAS
jgi:predicted HTH transcriptional regulator